MPTFTTVSSKTKRNKKTKKDCILQSFFYVFLQKVYKFKKLFKFFANIFDITTKKEYIVKN